MTIAPDMEFCLSQRSIYDARFAAGSYDRRSAVPVLLSESKTLQDSFQHVASSMGDSGAIAICDFGYGSGRVTNQFLIAYVADSVQGEKDLRILAYDVSSNGLQCGMNYLHQSGVFEICHQPLWDAERVTGYVAGSMISRRRSPAVQVIFVHGSEEDAPAEVRALLEEANEGSPVHLTTSWYSGLAHVPCPELRYQYISELGALTSADGELVLSVPSLGDLKDQRFDPGASHGVSISKGQSFGAPLQDAIYETELGQRNYCHLFGEDLIDIMTRITEPSQSWHIKAIRFPDPEFASNEDALRNYERVTQFNALKGAERWTVRDFERCHTVAAIRGIGVH